ncbi:MAG: helix-turn-helix domain-containing protein [Chloroflexota bacterium]
MKLQIHTPTDPLRSFVKSIILYEGYTGSHRFEMLLPDGNLQLVIALDDRPRAIYGGAGKPDRALKQAWLTGLQMQPVIYHSEQNASTLVIQFEVGGLFALTGMPASEFESAMIDASSVIDCWLEELRDALYHIPFVNRLQYAEACLLDQLLKSQRDLNYSRPVGAVWYAVQALYQNHSSLSIISDSVNYSQKRLIELFKLHVGVSPKRYARLLRFSRALQHVTGGENLSEIAHQLGYYDQAHMSNEFRSFAAMTPAVYRQSPRDYPHVLPTDTIM